MKLTINCLLLLFVLQLLHCFAPVHAQQQLNAVIPGDFADPSIIRAGNTYYAIGTSSEWAPHFPIYTSTDLKTWKQHGFAFDKKPEWTSGSFWAPEYYYHKGTYFIYYTARRKKDNMSYIGVATSKYPDRGFTDHGVIIEHGKEAIDAFVFNDNGQLYISFKAYGLEDRPIELLGSKLSDDGLHLEGGIFPMLKDDRRMGMEGQSILKRDGFYYIFYSAGGCCGLQCSYNVSMARAENFKGPYTYYSKNPALSEIGDWKCIGHGTFVTTPQNEQYYLSHGYNRNSTVFSGRQGLLSKLTWPEKKGWPKFTVQPGPAAITASVDSFKTTKAATFWQWDFRHSTPVVKQGDHKLHLSGTATEDNLAGIALTMRPVSAQFELTTEVINHNDALKGLVFYGDANAALGIGVKNNTLEFWMIKDKKRAVLATETIDQSIPVALKLKMLPDHSCTVFYRQANNDWKQLNTLDVIKVDFLPQWDRTPRVGLNFSGNANEEAVFSYVGLASM